MRKTLAAVVLAAAGCASHMQSPQLAPDSQELNTNSVAQVTSDAPSLSENYFLEAPQRLPRRIIDRRLDMDTNKLFLGISFDVQRGDQISALVDGQSAAMHAEYPGSWTEYRLLINSPGLPKFHRPGAIELELGEHVLDIQIQSASGQIVSRRYEFSLQGEIRQEQGMVLLYDGSRAESLPPLIKEEISRVLGHINTQAPGSIDLVTILPTTNMGSAYYGRGNIVLPLDQYLTPHVRLEDQLRSVEEILYHEGGHGVFDTAFLGLSRTDADGCRRSYIIGESPICTRNQALYQQWLTVFSQISERGLINTYKDSNFSINPKSGHPHSNADEFFASCFMIKECGYLDAFRQRPEYLTASQETRDLLDRPFALLGDVIVAARNPK